jgi:hypothetical protein
MPGCLIFLILRPELQANAIELSPYSNAVTRNMIESQVERRGQGNGIMH